MTQTANKKHKDSVFSLLFSDKEKLIELYNAIKGTNYGLDTKIQINTIENALYLDRINDISFIIDDKLVILIEHQSTINENMPLRFLLYISAIYEGMLDHRNIYASRILKIPTPEFIVLYNGNDPYPDQKVMRLSNAYKESDTDNWLELVVKVYNINSGRNEEIVKKSEVLDGYVQFIANIKENIKRGLSLENAIGEAVKYCIDNEILSEFLAVQGSKVRNMLFTEFNIEDAKQVWRADGIQEGIEIGIEKVVFGMLAEGLPDTLIKQILRFSDEELNKIKKKHASEERPS